MAATLATLRDRVELKLADSGNNIWSTGDIDEAVRQALHEYSKTRPRQAVDLVTLAAAGREIDVSGVTGLLQVIDLWLPYTAASPEYPPNRRPFRHWADLGLLVVVDDPASSEFGEPAAGEVARVFYTAMQTLKDLDSATVTTVPLDDESLLVTGAAGHAATSRAVDLAEQVTIDRLTSQQVRAWGLNQLQEFRAGLRNIARQLATTSPPWVPLPPRDRWDKGRGKW